MDLYTKLCDKRKLFLIAGPCVVETDAVMREVAETLLQIQKEFEIAVIFKSSYAKANRSSGDSYAGPGMAEGLRALEKIKREYGLPLLTDIHEQSEAEMAAAVCDILQIPAFLCRQTALIQAAAETGRIVNLKKGQFMAPEDMQAAALKAGKQSKVLLTERGCSFGYHDLVVDFRSFAVMGAIGHPVVYDVTHSLQKPSTGKTSGGCPDYAPMMARAAVATGWVDGLFLETHPKPREALSDAASMLPLEQLKPLIEECLRIKQEIGRTR